MDNSDDEQRTVWCGNLSDKISEDILYELFLQAAPLERVRIPKDKDGKQSTYGFVTFKHLVSVQYATELLNGIALFDKRINIKPRVGNLQRQNSHHRDHSPVYAQQLQHVNPPENLLNTIQNLDILMQMGDQLLINTKTHGSSHDNYNQNMRPAPYRRWDHSNYRDDRRDDNRPNYRRHNHHRGSDRHNSNNTSYHGSRRYDR